jgi:4'-phosphopantetheinyl transferase EntD
LPAERRGSMATVLFSAKESFYKAQYSLTRQWLDFKSAAVTIQGDSWHLQLLNPQSALARLQRPLHGRFFISNRYDATTIAIHAVQHGD